MLNPAYVSVGGGLPHPSSFPIHKATFELEVPPNYDGSPYNPSSSSTTNGHANDHANGHANGHANSHSNGQFETKSAARHAAKSDARTTMTFHKAEVGPNGERAAIDLARAQQYSKPACFQPFRDGIQKLIELAHNPPYEYDFIPTGGNTDATTKVFKALLDSHDTLLVEEHSFAPPMAAARALGAGIRGVPMDTTGIVPEALDKLLSDWDVTQRGKKCVLQK